MIKKIKEGYYSEQQTFSIIISKINTLIEEVNSMNDTEQLYKNLNYLLAQYKEIRKKYPTGLDEAFWAEGTQNKQVYEDALKALKLIEIFITYYENKYRNSKRD